MDLSSPLDHVMTVSELNRHACNLLEEHFSAVYVVGEISNFKRYDSGHCYFLLKDAKAQVRCVMFRHRAVSLGFQPCEGMQVEARVIVSLYEVRGDFQLTIELLRPSGSGALSEAFNRLKQRLENEGLFDAGRKRNLPLLPNVIGIVTSPAAAALHDVLTTLKRRFPAIPLILYPTPVQGVNASQHITAAILKASVRCEVDVLIICRGGGSLEDLWAFNEEIVARAIADCSIPIVTGIGHETDFTIADFVADVRAPTPTAAAERASPNQDEWRSYLRQKIKYLEKLYQHLLQHYMQRLDHLASRLRHPKSKLSIQQQKIVGLKYRLEQILQYRKERSKHRLAMLRLQIKNRRPDLSFEHHRFILLKTRYMQVTESRLQQYRAQLSLLAVRLHVCDPKLPLQKGYALVKKIDGVAVHIAQALQIRDKIEIQFSDGTVMAVVDHLPTNS